MTNDCFASPLCFDLLYSAESTSENNKYILTKIYKNCNNVCIKYRYMLCVLLQNSHLNIHVCVCVSADVRACVYSNECTYEF